MVINYISIYVRDARIDNNARVILVVTMRRHAIIMLLTTKDFIIK